MFFMSIPFDGFRISLPSVSFGESRRCVGEVTKYRVLAFLDSENATLIAGYSEYPSLTPSQALQFFEVDKGWRGVVEILEWGEEGVTLFMMRDTRNVRFLRILTCECKGFARVYFAEVGIPAFFFREEQRPWIRHYLSSLVPDATLNRVNASSCFVLSVSQSSSPVGSEPVRRLCFVDWLMKLVQWLRSS